jgi:hypothetical protein
MRIVKDNAVSINWTYFLIIQVYKMVNIWKTYFTQKLKYVKKMYRMIKELNMKV